MGAVLFFIGVAVGLVVAAGMVWFLASPRKPKEGEAVSMTDVYRQSKQEIDKMASGLSADEIVGWDDPENPEDEPKAFLYRKGTDGKYMKVRELKENDPFFIGGSTQDPIKQA
jgi:hypothetical protein